MSVYVDKLRDYGWKLGPSCHMTADSLDELHSMAQSIGLKKAWFQDKKGHKHYDLVESKRKLAVAKGAIEVNSAIEYMNILGRINRQNEHKQG